MRQFFSVVALIGGLIGALFVFAALFGGGSSAIQEAAFAAVGVGFAVIPYCITRSIQLLMGSKDTYALQQIQRSLVEIRREIADTGVSTPSAGLYRTGATEPPTTGSQRVSPQRTMMSSRVEEPKRETIVHPEKGTTRPRSGENIDISARTKICPHCAEANRQEARVCFSCGSVIPGYTVA